VAVSASLAGWEILILQNQCLDRFRRPQSNRETVRENYLKFSAKRVFVQGLARLDMIVDRREMAR